MEIQCHAISIFRITTDIPFNKGEKQFCITTVSLTKWLAQFKMADFLLGFKYGSRALYDTQADQLLYM